MCACVSSSRVWLRIATAAQSCLRGLLRVFIVFKIRGFWAIGLIETILRLRHEPDGVV